LIKDLANTTDLLGTRLARHGQNEDAGDWGELSASEADIYQDHGLTQINFKGQRIFRRSSGSKFA
jgi:hypothetical protein